MMPNLTTYTPTTPDTVLPYRDMPYYPEPVNAGGGFGLDDIIRLVKRNRLLILAIVVPVTLLTLVWQLASPTLYKTTASVRVQLIDDIGANQADIMARNNLRVANEAKLYRSNAAAQQIVRDLALHRDPTFAREMGGISNADEAAQIRRAATTLMNMVEVASDEGSDQMEISVTARSPELAAKLANQIPRSVAELRVAAALDRRRDILASLENKRSAREADAIAAAQQLADYRIKNQILVGGGGVEDLQQLNRIATEAASARGMQAATAAQGAGVARAAGMRSVSAASSPVVQHLRQRETDVAAEMAKLGQSFGANHPDMQRLAGELAEVRSSLAGAEASALADATAAANAESARMTQLARSEASGASARAGQLAGILGAMTAKAYQNTANSVELDKLTRAADQAARGLEELTQRIAQIHATTEQEGVVSEIVSPAVANFNPVAPMPLKLTMVALLGSAILGLILAFARELVDTRLRTVAQVRKLFGLPTFGMLPLIENGVSSDLLESPIIQDPQSLFAEVARATYAEISELAEGDGAQTVLISSPMPSEGKSVVALSLAVAAVAAGKRAVVLDLDLRKSGIIQQIQKHLNTPDLLELLMGRVELRRIGSEASAEDIADATEDFDDDRVDLSRLALLSVAKPIARPAAVIGSQRLQMLMDRLRDKFDLIVINAPPTLAVRDAVSMAQFADHTVLVARWGHTNIDQMRAAIEMLGEERVDGVVYSQVDYAEHARRVYGDTIQYYFESAEYYGGTRPQRVTLMDEIRAVFGQFRKPAAT